MKDDLVALVSHELRNPLSAIRGYTETLLDEMPECRQMAVVIDRHAAHMQTLVDDLLDLARLDAGRMAIDRQPVPAGKLLRDAVAGQRRAADAKSLTVTVDVPRDLLVYADPTRLRQVIDNLMSNAVKYTPAGGTVALAGRAGDTGTTLTVADTGIGIPPGEYPHLFDRFFRASNAVARGTKGTGLGLSICKAIVEAHTGTLTAAPATPSPGTVITITLPAVPLGR
jgi:signal transduction histidine kinase